MSDSLRDEPVLEISYTMSKDLMRYLVIAVALFEVIVIFSVEYLKSISSNHEIDIASRAVSSLLLKIHIQELLSKLSTNSLVLLQIGTLIGQSILLISVFQVIGINIGSLLKKRMQKAKLSGDLLLFCIFLISNLMLHVNFGSFMSLSQCYTFDEKIVDDKYVILDLIAGDTKYKIVTHNRMRVYPTIDCFSNTYFLITGLSLINVVAGVSLIYFLNTISRVSFSKSLPHLANKLYLYINTFILVICVGISNYGYLIHEQLRTPKFLSLAIFCFLWVNYAISMSMKIDLNEEFDRIEKMKALLTLIIASIILNGHLYHEFVSSSLPTEMIIINLLLISGLIKIHTILTNQSTSMNNLILNMEFKSSNDILKLYFRLKVMLLNLANESKNQAQLDSQKLDTNYWHVIIDQHRKHCKERCRFCQKKYGQLFTKNETNPLDPEFLSMVVYFVEHLMRSGLNSTSKIATKDLYFSFLNFNLDLTGNFVENAALLYSQRNKHANLLSWIEQFLFKRKMQRKISYYLSEGKADRPTLITRQPNLDIQQYQYKVILEFHSSMKHIPDCFIECHKKLAGVFEELINTSRTNEIIKRAVSLHDDRLHLERELLSTQTLCQGRYAPIINQLCYFYKNIDYSTEKYKKWIKEYIKAQKNIQFSHVISRVSFHEMMVVIVGQGEEDYHRIKSVNGESFSLLGFHHYELVDRDLSVILPNFLKYKHRKFINMRSIYGSILERKKGIYAFTKTADDLIILLKVTKRIHFTLASGCMLMGVLEQIPGETTSVDTFYLIVSESGDIHDLNKEASNYLTKGRNLAEYNSKFKTVFYYLEKAMSTVFGTQKAEDITNDRELLNSWRVLLEFRKGIAFELSDYDDDEGEGEGIFNVQIQDFIFGHNNEFIWIVSMTKKGSLPSKVGEMDGNYRRFSRRVELEDSIRRLIDSFSCTLDFTPISTILSIVTHNKEDGGEGMQNSKSASLTPSQTPDIPLTLRTLNTMYSSKFLAPSSLSLLLPIYAKLSTSQLSTALKIALTVVFAIFVGLVVLAWRSDQLASSGILEIEYQIPNFDTASFSITGHAMVSLIIDVFRAEKEGWMDEEYTADIGIYPKMSYFYLENVLSLFNNILLRSEIQFDAAIVNAKFRSLIDIEGWIGASINLELPKIDYEHNSVVLGWEPKTLSRRAATEYLNDKVKLWLNEAFTNYEFVDFLGPDRNRNDIELEELLRRNLQGDISKFYYGYVFQFYEYMKGVAAIPGFNLAIRVAAFGIMSLFSALIIFFSIFFDLNRFREIYELSLAYKKVEIETLLEMEKAKITSAAGFHLFNEGTKEGEKSRIDPARALRANEKAKNKNKKKATEVNSTVSIKLIHTSINRRYFKLVIFLTVLSVALSCFDILILSNARGTFSQLQNTLKVEILVVEAWGSFMNAQNALVKLILWNDTSNIWGKSSSAAFEEFQGYITQSLLANFTESLDYNLGNYTETYMSMMTSVPSCGRLFLLDDLSYFCEFAYSGGLNSPLLTSLRHIAQTQRNVYEKWKVSRNSFEESISLLYDSEFKAGLAFLDIVAMDLYFNFGQDIGASLLGQIYESLIIVTMFKYWTYGLLVIWSLCTSIAVWRNVKDSLRRILSIIKLVPERMIWEKGLLLKKLAKL